MKRFLKSFHYGNKGFTLIELLIVVLILGVLAAAIVPNVSRFMQTGQKGAAESELGSVQVAVYAGMADNGVGTIVGNAAGVDKDGGVINAAPPIDIDEYLQGGVARLKGTWVVADDGLVESGSFPTDTPHWVYVEAGDPTTGNQWEYVA